jgi:N utilization substance protein B
VSGQATSGARRRARECALQIMYSLDLNPSLTAAQACAHFWKGLESEENGGTPQERDASVVTFAEQLVEGTMTELQAIDAVVQKASKNWRLERMARVDRNLLRLATYELRYLPDVPVKVVINEAIEVAKKYGAAESPAFVNGLLDRIAQELGRT